VAEWLVNILSVVATIVSSLAVFAYWLGRRFEAIDRRFEMIEERFKMIDRRFEEVDKRFSALDAKFDRFARVMASYVESVYSTLVDFMSLKGLFTPEEKRFLISELERLTRAHLAMLNPLKPEEAKFILEVIRELREKDPREFDLSKLDKVIEIARRWLWEDGHPDAARMLFIAYMLKAIVRKEKGEYDYETRKSKREHFHRQ